MWKSHVTLYETHNYNKKIISFVKKNPSVLELFNDIYIINNFINALTKAMFRVQN